MKKKIFKLLVISFVLLVNLSSVFAEGVAVPSIEVKNSVYIEDGEVLENGTTSIIQELDDDCRVEVVVTPYSLKDTITRDYTLEQFEEAYQTIVDAKDVVELNAGLADYAAALNTTTDHLVVSDLFDISVYHIYTGERHDIALNHEAIRNLKVRCESAKNFVCLLHYNDNDQWEIVTDFERNGNLFSLTYYNLSPFAIVTRIEDPVEPPVNPGCDDCCCPCLLHINGKCYCPVLVLLLFVSVTLNILLLIRKTKAEKVVKKHKLVSRNYHIHHHVNDTFKN